MQYVKNFKKFFLISILVIVVGFGIGIARGGLNMGIDFSGGSIITVDMKGGFEASAVEGALRDAGEKGFTVLKSATGNAQEQTYAQLRVRPKNGDEEDRVQRETILAEIQKIAPEAEISNVERVGAVASASLIRNAVFALLIAWVLILIYISIRFQFHSGLASLSCLVHDVLVMLAVVCALQVEINSPFIAAVLTIVGYSINNTIVVFDRIRDNRKELPNKKLAEIVDLSTSQTLRRSIFTALTTFITIACLYIFGADAIRSFALPIMVGLLAGTYSSLFMAGPIWELLDRKLGPGKRSSAPATGKKSAQKA